MLPFFRSSRNADRQRPATRKPVRLSPPIAIGVARPAPGDLPWLIVGGEPAENPTRSARAEPIIRKSFAIEQRRHAIERVSLPDRTESELEVFSFSTNPVFFELEL